MHVGFKITLEDGSTITSHDEMWNEKRDHSHALAPHNTKKWLAYEIVTDTGLSVGVDFRTGIFVINGQVIHAATEQGKVLTNLTDAQSFSKDKAWSILDGMPYFPVVGRRVFKGDMVDATLHFCGWKRKDGVQTVIKMAFLYPNGAIVLT